MLGRFDAGDRVDIAWAVAVFARRSRRDVAQGKRCPTSALQEPRSHFLARGRPHALRRLHEESNNNFRLESSGRRKSLDREQSGGNFEMSRT